VARAFAARPTALPIDFNHVDPSLIQRINFNGFVLPDSAAAAFGIARPDTQVR
jgi:hypothetical protein